MVSRSTIERQEEEGWLGDNVRLWRGVLLYCDLGVQRAVLEPVLDRHSLHAFVENVTLAYDLTSACEAPAS
jgi:hypothetical protein